MKHKTKYKAGLILKAGFLALFVFAEFFGFGVIQKVSAACSYNITRFDTQSSVTRTGTLNFNVTVKRAGTSSECSNDINLTVYAKASYDEYPTMGDGMSVPVHYDFFELTRRSASFNNTDTTSLGFTYNLSSLSSTDWQKIPDQNSFQTYLVVRANNTNVAQSSIWPVNVTGASGTTPGSGLRNVTLTFDRATYNKDDNINIVIKLDNPSGAPRVEIVTYVNGQEVGAFEKDGTALSSSQIQQVSVKDQTGFKNGNNTISVKMFQSGTNRAIEFANGSGQVQATGLTTTTNPGSGNSQNPGSGATQNPGAQPGGGAAVGNDKLYNPLPTGDLINMFLIIGKGFLGITGLVAVVFIIIGGFQMVIAAGNEETYVKARKTVTWAILGLVIALLSFSIVSIVQSLLNANVRVIQ